MRLGSALIGIMLLGDAFPDLSAASESGEKWRSDVVVMPEFSVSIDTAGFDFPSAIAFVPHPGPDPKSPLYFVTELRGKVRVVTRDRSVFTFAEGFFEFAPPEELPGTYGEIGMAGITLDPARGYVFVSFVYEDQEKVYRNSIVRFESEPGTFGLKAKGLTSFAGIFSAEVATNHQIGPMVLDGNTLFVGVGDGFQALKSQDLTSTLGKILRMTVDGDPVADNPFYVNGDRRRPENYVWATGLRNPFGLALVNGRLFCADNGLNVDRFMEIQRGGNYRWDGTDWSTGMNAPMVFGPAVGPVQLTWLAPDSGVFPESYRSRFFLALSAGRSGARGIALLDYDFALSRMATRPTQFLRHLGQEDAFLPVGCAFGPDGLYVVLLNYSGKKGTGRILRVVHDPARAERERRDHIESAQSIMLRLACVHCHAEVTDQYLHGPPLDARTLVPRILARLGSDDYRRAVSEIDEIAEEPFSSWRDARTKVMRARGVEQVRLWLQYRIMEPRFDRKSSAMPTIGATEREARQIADYLVGRYLGDDRVLGRLKAIAGYVLPRDPGRRHVAMAFALGAGAGSALVVFGWAATRFVARRRQRA
jgi:glucose/arabinose dehydrogenase